MTPFPRWRPADQPPLKPGRYWTMTITRIERGAHGLTTTHYTHDWRRWDGQAWDGELSQWYDKQELL